MHRHIEDLRKELLLIHVLIFIYFLKKDVASCQDPNDMYDITGYNLFRNDNHNSVNESRPYGDTAVYNKIP